MKSRSGGGRGVGGAAGGCWPFVQMAIQLHVKCWSRWSLSAPGTRHLSHSASSATFSFRSVASRQRALPCAPPPSPSPSPSPSPWWPSCRPFLRLYCCRSFIVSRRRNSLDRHTLSRSPESGNGNASASRCPSGKKCGRDQAERRMHPR